MIAIFGNFLLEENRLSWENLNNNFCIECSVLHSSLRLNVVTMEWQGQLILMGYRIFVENNNDGDAVNEEGNSIQDQEVQIEMEEEQEGCEDSNTSISSLLKSDEIEVEQEDGAAGSNLSKSVEFASTSENLSVAEDWCVGVGDISIKNYRKPLNRYF